MSMQRLSILGSTGSIGTSTLDVAARHPDRFRVFALTAHRQIDRLFEQCRTFLPEVAVVGDAEGAAELTQRLRTARLSTEVAYGPQALSAVASAPGCDTVVAAIVGAAGLASSLAAARAGKKILLANKEALVMSGALFMRTVAEHGATLLPLDSEHNAIFQCLGTGACRSAGVGVERLILTASGGPFLHRELASLDDVTPDQACKHPNWVMGRKISVDSATMMNKGLEVIEARWLFDMPPGRIEVLIHPQSVIHSMVAFADQSVLAQLGNPDMRTPIAHAMAHPERVDSGVAPLDLTRMAELSFRAPDLARFPCLRLGLQVLRDGCAASVTLNAANEVAVDAFLHEQIRFTDIARVVEQTLDRLPALAASAQLDDILAADELARVTSRQIMAQLPARRAVAKAIH
ncbi:1-deoxy-D-xylulose-5-phosphate reductoisomerase [Dyella japonica]|uniref:1-deoxy-D-xylulose 5-phosphate reductoisomerase n=1 Tax=Dyella japonica A8 TaxID=1217721 RepID=A0A075K1F2_9GAMM|nr:1-deoxy-D-xylulose-5-phosphate reductoisomerase [Dyella japonica]AIF48044.1 1-deoxy-D-xylulose 5-phosphate reductoisomerase [Dyella japonica A8]